MPDDRVTAPCGASELAIAGLEGGGSQSHWDQQAIRDILGPDLPLRRGKGLKPALVWPDEFGTAPQPRLRSPRVRPGRSGPFPDPIRTPAGPRERRVSEMMGPVFDKKC